MRFPLISRWSLRWFVGGLLVMGALRAEPRIFNVPAQRADLALLAFAQQAKIEIVFSSDALRRAKSVAVAGAAETEVALQNLLRGSGFVAQKNAPGKFVVIRAVEPVGSLRGVLRTVDGLPARGVRVAIAALRKSSTTDDEGRFAFEKLPVATYELIASGTGYLTLPIANAQIEADAVRTLDPITLKPSTDPTKLDPFLVLGKTGDSRSGRRRAVPFPPQTAIGNIDLPRTENDVLPFTIYDRSQIDRSGVANLNAFLQRELLDSDASAHSPEQDGTAASYAIGSSNVRMRGFGEDETIVLVNGRRLPEVLNSLTSSVGRHPAPDVNFIPLSLVERVEVLPISASALYSGNPVGGVINIVLRPDVNGTEVSSTYTNALGGYDAPQTTVSLQHGLSLLNGALRLRLNATFTRSTPVVESELGYIARNDAAHPPIGFPIYRATPNITTLDGSPLFGPGTAAFTSVAPGAKGDGGLTAFASRQGVSSLALFNAPGGFATSPESSDYSYGRRQRGATYFGSATYDIASWLQLGIDGTFTQTKINRGYSVFTGDLTLDAALPQNPFHQDVSITLNETVPALGENYDETKLDFYSAVAGLLVKLPQDWRVSFDGQYSRSLTHYRGISAVDTARWQELVDRGIYNPLRDTQVVGPPQEFYDRALIYYGSRGRFVSLGDYQTIDSAVRITNQNIVWPTGPGAISLGGDYRLTQLADYGNHLSYGDGSEVAAPFVYRGRMIQRLSAFGEIQAPVLPERWLPRAVRSIEADVAARYVVADTTQETNVAPTAGLKIDLKGGWMLRGTIATSNRLPTPILSSARATGSPVVGGGGGEVETIKITDPLRNNEAYNVSASDAYYPGLHPESSVTRTLGVIYQRGRVHRFRGSIDFSDTEKSGELRRLSAPQLVVLESNFPDRVIRGPLSPGDMNAVGRVTDVLTGDYNLARRHSQNFNTSLDYSWAECFNGRLDLYTRWSWFQHYDVQLLPGSPLVDELNDPDDNTLRLIRHRVNLGGSWSNSLFGFGVDGHYYGSRRLVAIERDAQGADEIRQVWQFDGSAQANLGHWLRVDPLKYGLKAQIRVNNVLNAAPPRYVNDSSGAGVQSYGDWWGRTYSLSVTATF